MLPVICLGGCCVPLNMLMPFLIVLLHRLGLLKWFKPEWVTFVFWKKQFQRLIKQTDKDSKSSDADQCTSQASTDNQSSAPCCLHSKQQTVDQSPQMAADNAKQNQQQMRQRNNLQQQEVYG